jgi:hypothetical protein
VRGGIRRAQGALPFEYEVEAQPRGLTGWAGLPVYLDLAGVMGLADSIDCHVGARDRGLGWTDSQQVLSVVLLQLAGGDCVDDLERLEADEGLRILIHRLEDRHRPRPARPARLRSASGARGGRHPRPGRHHGGEHQERGPLRLQEEALRALPRGVEQVRLRSHSAAYDWELLRDCEEGGNERFGRIQFAISCDVPSESSKQATPPCGGTARRALVTRSGAPESKSVGQ